MRVLFGFLGIVTSGVHASQVPSLTKQYAAEYCTSASTPSSYSPQDASLVDYQVGSPNYIEETILDVTCTNIVDCLKDERSSMVATGFRVGMAFLLAAITILLWLVMSPCACCQCYRGCGLWCCCKVSERKSGGRNMHRHLFYFLTIVFVIFVAGLVAALIYAVNYAGMVNDGGQNMLCQAYSLASETLNGNSPGIYTDPYTGETATHLFVGTEEIGAAIDSLDAAFAPSSPVLSSIDDTITETVDLTYTLESFAAYLTFTNAVLGSETNMNVGSHECLACKACCGGGGSYMDQLTTVFTQSYAVTLAGLRTEISDNLVGAGLDSVRSAVDKADELITDLNDRFEASIGHALVNNKDMIDTVLIASKWTIIGLLILVALPTILLLINVIWGVFLGNRSSYKDPYEVPGHPLAASCGWCWAFFYAILILLVAGAFSVLGYIEGSTCLMTANSDQFIDDVFFRLDAASDSSNQDLHTGLDTCFKSTGSGDLLDEVVVVESTGTTAKDILSFAQVMSNDLDVVFDVVTAPVKIMEEPVFIRLLWVLREFGSMYLLPVETITELRGSVTGSYQAMFESGFGGVPDCSGRQQVPLNGTIGSWVRAALVAAGSENVPSDHPLSFVDLPGSAEYFSDSQVAGQSLGTTGVSCPGYNPSDVHNSPWDVLMVGKMDVLDKTDYRCDKLSITRSAANEAVVVVSSVACNFAEFTAYIASLADDLEAQARLVDAAAAATATKIDTNIRDPIQQDIIPFLNEISNGVDCRFIYDRWLYMYRSLCWDQAPGFIGLSYTLIGLAVLAWIALLVQFMLWQHLRANWTAWVRDRRADGE